MKKNLIVFFLLFQGLVSVAQIRTTTFQGRVVKIFPYRMQLAETNYSWDNMFENMSIPYCPEKLEDGEYIIYYKPQIDLNNYEKSLKQFAKGDTLFVAINFFIKNGLKEGTVTFYDYNFQKKPLATGHYTSDTKSGIWKLISGDGKVTGGYKNGKLEGLVLVEKAGSNEKLVMNYKEGQMDGKMETYKGKKLISSYTFKAGKTYGPYFESGKDEWPDGYKLSGFSLDNDFDSITQMHNKKNKLIQCRLNSFNPLIGTDTSEWEWYIFVGSFKMEINKLLQFHSNHLDYNKALYTNCYEINTKGQKINNLYLINEKIKVPFVYLNFNGDTVLKVERAGKNKRYITYSKTEIEYDKNHHVKNKEVSLSKVLIDGSYTNLVTDSIIYKESYDGKTIDKQHILNRPVPGYKGFVIKKDSTSSIDPITLQPTNSIREEYSIYQLYTFTKWTHKWGDSDITNFTWPDIEYKLIGMDTIEVVKKNTIDESLRMTKTFKICIKDSTINGLEDNQLINPADICGGWGWETVSFIGKSNYVIYYKDIPFSGSLFINNKLSKRLGKYETKLKLKETKDGLRIIQFIHQERNYKRVVRNLKRRLVKDYSNEAFAHEEVPLNFRFNYYKGKLNGYQWAGIMGENLYQLNFKNGISHGFQNYCLKKSRLEPLRNGEYLSRINYDSGRIDGYVVLNDKENNPLLVTKYNKGKLNGTYVEFNRDLWTEPKPLLEANFINDTLNGWVITYHYGEEKERIPFVKGEATGYYYKNTFQKIEAEQSDSAHGYQYYIKIYKELKIKLNNGAIKDTIYGYFDIGGIKYTAVIDNGFHHKYIKSWGPHFLIKEVEGAIDTSTNEPIDRFDWENAFGHEETIRTYPSGIIFGIQTSGEQKGIDLDPMYDYVKATFTFYYKNGVKSQEGKMVNNEKYGTWKYYAENGTLMKEIEYNRGIDSTTPNTIYYRGKIKGYYPSGKKMMEGLITDQELSYQCNQEVEIAYEEVYYLSFFNEAGDSLLKRKSGPVVDYHLNGTKHFSGQITNGLRTGLWRFYDPNGNLDAIGEYADGQKQGKWLTGDLGGINYLDNACSVNEALSLMKERQLQDIDITETLYEMGTEISSSHLVLEKF